MSGAPCHTPECGLGADSYSTPGSTTVWPLRSLAFFQAKRIKSNPFPCRSERGALSNSKSKTGSRAGQGFGNLPVRPAFRRSSLLSVTIVCLRNLPLTEPCSVFSVPIVSESVKKTAKKNALHVCLLSPHPLVLSEFERVLSNPEFKTVSRHLESTLGPDLRHLPIPKAAVYVVDAHVARPAAGALLSNILDHHSE